MKRLGRLRRGEKYTTEEKLNEIIDEINNPAPPQVGPGLEVRQTPAGPAVSLAPSMRRKEQVRGPRVFYQDDEPDAAEWRACDFWIDTSTEYDGKYYQAWMKTQHDPESNDSKVPLTILVNS